MAKVTGDELAQVMRFMEVHRTAAFGRRLFTTVKGYMGVGPARMRRGNAVALPAGRRMPYVLRRQKDRCFAFLGECYVHFPSLRKWWIFGLCECFTGSSSLPAEACYACHFVSSLVQMMYFP